MNCFEVAIIKDNYEVTLNDFLSMLNSLKYFDFGSFRK